MKANNTNTSPNISLAHWTSEHALADKNSAQLSYIDSAIIVRFPLVIGNRQYAKPWRVTGRAKTIQQPYTF